MSQGKDKWTLLKSFKMSHKYFALRAAPGSPHTKGSGGVAIADLSGAYPEDTEDGLLWVDRSCPVMFAVRGDGHNCGVDVPLIDENGSKTWSPINFLEFKWLVGEEGLHMMWDVTVLAS
ncbi:unnamed protein product [marine sediment metagenome]|uniref:Uncharacterized protein n=1 Tax=marine sediment metagenome TaxID=412755 RepID=X0UWL5_9ZZZZ